VQRSGRDSPAANHEDQLIIEGYPLMQGNQRVLLAQNCTSGALQRVQKQAHQQQAQRQAPQKSKTERPFISRMLRGSLLSTF
jgi:hypothetical protein